jgi:hypothetical protein
VNLQEHIRKVLIEETSLSPFIRRRVPYHELEKEFKESLNMASEMIFNAYKRDNKRADIGRFSHLVIAITMDGIHHYLHSAMPEDSEWYVDVYNILRDYYQDRIESRYKEIQKLISNIIE